MRLTERDIATLEAVQRHWWLPSRYLHQFTKHLGKDETEQRKVLKRLVDAGYLAKPIAINNPSVKNDFLNYTLADKGKSALAKAGTLHAFPIQPAGGYEHAAMTIAITASIELFAERNGVSFIPQNAIISDAPQKTRMAKNPLSLPSNIQYTVKGKTYRSDRPTVPDALFGLSYSSGCRFFAVEADRSSEPIEPKSLSRNSILRKLLCYKDILITKAYKEAWDIPSLIVLFVTTNEERMQNMLEVADRVYPRSENLLFTHLPGFAPFFRSPPIFPQLWNAPWQRAGREPFHLDEV